MVVVSLKALFWGVLLTLALGAEDIPYGELYARGGVLPFDCGSEYGAEFLLGSRATLFSEYEAESLVENGESLSLEHEVVFPSGDGAELFSERREDRFSDSGEDMSSEAGVGMQLDDGAELLSDNLERESGLLKFNLMPDETEPAADSGVWSSLPVAVPTKRAFFFGRSESCWVEVKRTSDAGLGERLALLVEDLVESERLFPAPASHCGT